MLLEDYIKKSISEYPSLYAKSNYKDSRISVLNQVFLVLGNGLDWAYTKNPKQGGYVVYPNYYKFKGDYKRKYDLPYGKEKYEGPDIERFFHEMYIEIYPVKNIGEFITWVDRDKPCLFRGFLSDIPKSFFNKCTISGYKNDKNNIHLDFELNHIYVLAYLLYYESNV